jgi:(p)ppGpp synthase/HD superfamily hydrolase
MSPIEQAEAFARRCHAGQTRKGAAQEPYITHVEEVARMTALWGGGEAAVVAAWLHDTVEDCPPTSTEDIARMFGVDVARIVAELTDDKSLSKAERKRLQIENAPKKSPEASLVKIADKTSNVAALRISPPASWSVERRAAYLDWAEAVVSNLAHRPAEAVKGFEAALAASRAAL